MSALSMMIDIGLALLLAGAIGGGVMLSRRLDRFRESRAELAQLVVQLTTAVNQSHAAIGLLKTATQDADKALGDRLDKVRRLTDELEIMTQAGDSLARRLERAAMPQMPAHPTRSSGLAARLAELDGSMKRGAVR